MAGRRRIWTEAEDEALAQLIAAGGSTNDAAARFGCGRQHALAHAKKIGVMRPRTRKEQAFNRRTETHTVVAYPRDIWPLPAGHPETWSVINRGTVLEGQEYPR